MLSINYCIIQAEGCNIQQQQALIYTEVTRRHCHDPFNHFGMNLSVISISWSTSGHVTIDPVGYASQIARIQVEVEPQWRKMKLRGRLSLTGIRRTEATETRGNVDRISVRSKLFSKRNTVFRCFFYAQNDKNKKKTALVRKIRSM